VEERPPIDIHNLYTSPNINRSMKSRRMRWTEHVTRMENTSTYNNVVTKLKEHIVQETGWAPGPVWTCMEKKKYLALTGFFPPCPGVFLFDPFLYCLNPFVLHVNLRSTLPSLQLTQHKHPCPRCFFFFPVRGFSPLIHFCPV
jgi:hypothetical protein